MTAVLTELHNELGKQLLTILKDGIPMKDDETGKITKAPAPAAMLNVMRQFLKDCNIQGTTDNPSIAGIVEGLPDFSQESTHLPSATH
jgi:hypothetical protein